MMPLTVKTADTVMERGALVRKIINDDRKGFERFLFPYVIQQLMKFDGQPEEKRIGRCIAFSLATQMASVHKEWRELIWPLRQQVGKETYDKYFDPKGVSERGKQPPE